MNTKTVLTHHLKASFGWSTKRKIVCFSMDDYGNIRIANPEARENMKKAGLDVEVTRFDLYDNLESKEDLKQLYQVLSSVKDKHGNSAIFTALTNVANPNYEQIKADDFQKYTYELLPETYNKLEGYDGTMEMWQKGIENKLIMPQFHGREHLSLKVFMGLLQKGHPDALVAFENRSFGAISNNPFPRTSYVQAYSFNELSENEGFHEIITDGLNAFEKVFGFRAQHFAAPGAREHSILGKSLKEGGIKFVDADFINVEHQGLGKYTKSLCYNGKKNASGQTYLVRNCLFEPVQLPNVPESDWVTYTLKQIEIAFSRNKPANISGHRINFVGGMDPKVREKGLSKLQDLLKAIVKKWPEVEFMSTVELGNLMLKK